MAQGRKRLAGKLSLDHGTLVIFDRRSDAPPLEQRHERSQVEEQGRQITVLRL